jgi:hypothetical protein
MDEVHNKESSNVRTTPETFREEMTEVFNNSVLRISGPKTHDVVPTRKLDKIS